MTNQVINGHKRCTVCKKIKPTGDYYKNSKGGVFGPCKPCNWERSIKWRHNNIEKSRAAGRKWYKKNPDAARAMWLKKSYGITINELNEMIAKQWGGCAICGRTNPPKGQGGFHIDHCHKTKKVRGVLCSNCNLGLGNFQEDYEILKSAIRYLKKKR